ncbi:uncharacterized protein BHQ10_001715 [Talaromyces amestolkiae]|uniref:cutinase n=1 Tax=Talaromyces amestolkiae TaxID=1196081 RepID=A0A364KQA0_TALAM|nr:uncharacterized protein BHQ10_001715 [Talaromyces amestolkiae]RAO65703.1 hypothetical protein BHQ10_001715 [Talaromyces amestolkiae]
MGANSGDWVGPQFFREISGVSGSVTLQGGDADVHAVDLSGYLAEGGSSNGASSMADSVTAHNAQYPDSEIVVSGWRQSALVAHKALQNKSPPLSSTASSA